MWGVPGPPNRVMSSGAVGRTCALGGTGSLLDTQDAWLSLVTWHQGLGALGWRGPGLGLRTDCQSKPLGAVYLDNQHVICSLESEHLATEPICKILHLSRDSPILSLSVARSLA